MLVSIPNSVEIFKSLGSKSHDASTKKWSFSLSDYDELIEAVKVLKNKVEVIMS